MGRAAQLDMRKSAFLPGVNSVTHVFSTILNFIKEFKEVIRKAAAIC